jgi:iron only hydrogenase large subunit-like protein
MQVRGVFRSHHLRMLSERNCSGCVTSAESVLIEQMNIAAMLAAVAAHKAAGGIVVLSTTSQTITAMSIALAIPQLECLAKLKTFFHSIGVDYVLDCAAARLVTNAETAHEFMQRVTFEGGGGVNGVLSSTCPGWVCYVEKSQPCALPYLSSVRSPQQIQGVIVKTILARALGVPSQRVFHCTLMPCFDKKLEAMRLQFAPESVPDVDMVPFLAPLPPPHSLRHVHLPQLMQRRW